MKKPLSFAVLLFFTFFPQSISGQTGEELYRSNCAACHSIGKGRMVGPDLSGVYKKQTNEWLISFIRSSQKMIKAGDKDAVAIFNEYNKIPMPDNNYSDEQIISIIEYIKTADQASGAIAEKPAAGSDTSTISDDTTKTALPADSLKSVASEGDTLKADPMRAEDQGAAVPTDTLQFTAENTSLGRALYNGNEPFANGGSPCNSCHNVKDQSFFGGGKLAIDLTFSYSKLGPAGLNAILANPPFPVMQAAVKNKPLTPEEIIALSSFLKSVDERNNTYTVIQPGGFLFVTIGFLVALFLIVHIYVFYDKRKINDPL